MTEMTQPSMRPGAATVGRSSDAPSHRLQQTPQAVLDTNVVFDWLLFADPASTLLQAAIERRQLRWIATQAMFDEFFHVIARGSLDGWAPRPEAMRASWALHCSLVAAPDVRSIPAVPRCTDPDDQMFIELAVARPAQWLLTKDRAVLRLSAQLARFGVRVMSLAAWAGLPHGLKPAPV